MKARVTYTCKECGAEVEKVVQKRTSQEANEWEAWAHEHCTLCDACYAKQRASEDPQPLTLTISLNPMSTNYPVVLIYSGNTMEVRDKIKSNGYIWDYAPGPGLLGLLSTEKKKQWSKSIPADALDAETEAAKRIGATIKTEISQMDMLALREKIKLDAAKKQQKLDQAGPKPERPSILPTSGWNGKLYGSARSGYRIYVNGAETRLSESDGETIKAYIAAMEEYRAKLNQ